MFCQLWPELFLAWTQISTLINVRVNVSGRLVVLHCHLCIYVISVNRQVANTDSYYSYYCDDGDGEGDGDYDDDL